MQATGRHRGALLFCAALLLPSAAYAQAAIAGIVRDTSGAVLPGVTVEAASPVLIEGVRVAVTDGSGQYRIVDLRPGTYSVTFTLTGFRTVRREGVVLSGTFTAPVNIEMQVGALEETITVTGEAPIVDVQSARSEARIDADVISAIPTGRQFFNLASLVPGMSAATTDVGGSQGPSFTAFRTRGGARDEGMFQVNGFPVGWQGFGISYYVADLGAAQEVAFGLSGGMGDARTGGPTLNVIGREGGNTFRGSFYVNFANAGLEGSNFTQAHRDLGLRTPNSLQRLWDTNVNFGGPIVHDRLWFFSSYRHQGNRKLVADMWANLNAGDPTKWTYEPDLDRRARDTGTWINGTTRLTFQATPRNKLSVFWDEQKICRQCFGDEGGVGTGGEFAAVSPEATSTNEGFPQRHAHALWTSPVSSRVLVEGGASLNTVQWGGAPRGDVDTRDLIRVTEQTAGHVPNLSYRSVNWTRPFGYTWTWRASVSYVTGTHNAKVGYEGNYYWNRQMNFTNAHQLEYRLNNGIPNQLTMSLVSPLTRMAYTHDYSLYAQDQWTRGRLTLQGSARYEYITSGFPEQRVGPTRFLPQEIVYPAQKSGVSLHDIAPRVGGAYDLFGTGRTAVKATLGRYTGLPSGSNYYANPYNPVNLLQTSTNRAWADANRNFVPDCDLLNPVANGECGPWSNRAFGDQVVRITNDPDILQGWNKRFYNWDLNAGIRHELLPRLGIEVDYVRKVFGNFTVTDNRLVGPGDFDPFCITAPVDARLGGGVSGAQICDLWNIKPEKFGLSDDFITFASNYGTIVRHYNGVNATANARMANGLRVQGGVSTGRTVWDECDVTPKLDSPSTRFCRVEQPWQTEVSGLATYTIPRIAVQVSGTFFSKPMQADRGQGPNGNVVTGESLAANWVVPNALIAPSLGRNLAGGAANTTINLVEPGTLYGDRISNLDLRVAKVFRFDQRRLMVGVDVYNALNSSAATGYVQTFGPSWLRPSALLQARFAKVSAQFDF